MAEARTYAYRAEAEIDCERFHTALREAGVPITNVTTAPVDPVRIDQLVQFDTPADLDDVLAAARTVVDGHSIVRTLQQATLDDIDLSDYVRME